MHVYSSILDPYEPPRPARIYDNPQVVHRDARCSPNCSRGSGEPQ